MKKKNISLVGFMGTGKSAIGRNVAMELGYEFIDTDQYIERRVGTSIAGYFSQVGEEKFRLLERDCLKEILKLEGVVISTGGGIILLEENRRLLKENTFVVTLKALPKTIYYRTKRNNKRPLLRTQKPLKVINELLKQRRGLYDFGDIILYTDKEPIIELAKKVVAQYKVHNQ